MDSRLQGQNGLYSSHGNHSPLENSEFPAQYVHRPSQIAKIKDEFKKLANRKISIGSQVAAVPQHRDKTETDKELKHRVQQAGQSGAPNIMADILPANAPEGLDFSGFLCISA